MTQKTIDLKVKEHNKSHKIFALRQSRFSEIGNERFGYQGTLTLFDPPNRLDRIELSQTFADQPGAMRRFVERRGDSLYMCFVETDSFDALRDRLVAAGATQDGVHIEVNGHRKAPTLVINPAPNGNNVTESGQVTGLF